MIAFLILALAGLMTFASFKDEISDSFKEGITYIFPWTQPEPDFLDSAETDYEEEPDEEIEQAQDPVLLESARPAAETASQ